MPIFQHGVSAESAFLRLCIDWALGAIYKLTMLTNDQGFASNLVDLLSSRKYSYLLRKINALSTGTGSILRLIGEHPEGITLGETADILGISKPRITVAFSSLRRKNFLTRKKKKGESYLLFLTLSGQRELERLRAEAIEATEQFFAAIDDEGKTSLIGLLKQGGPNNA